MIALLRVFLQVVAVVEVCFSGKKTLYSPRKSVGVNDVLDRHVNISGRESDAVGVPYNALVKLSQSEKLVFVE